MIYVIEWLGRAAIGYCAVYYGGLYILSLLN